MKLAIILLISCLLFPFYVWSNDYATTDSINFLTIQPLIVPEFLLVIKDNSSTQIFAVKPDGTTLIRGKSVEQMSTDEAKIAMLALTQWVLEQQKDESMIQHMSKQTDYLLEIIARCEWRCK